MEALCCLVVASSTVCATVKTHLARCFVKMEICSPVELARIVSALPIFAGLGVPTFGNRASNA
jgi:hypothetical protein